MFITFACFCISCIHFELTTTSSGNISIFLSTLPTLSNASGTIFPLFDLLFLDDKSRRTMINHADRFIATSLYKTREEKEATGWKYKRTFDRDEIFVVRWKVSSGDWNCHVVLIWKQNYCIAGVAGNRLFLALSFHTFAAICQIVEILVLRKSLGKSLNLRAIALSLP